MDQEANLPDALLARATTAPDEPGSPAVATDLDDSFFETRRLREGGWDGPRKAILIGTLAETGLLDVVGEDRTQNAVLPLTRSRPKLTKVMKVTTPPSRGSRVTYG